MSATVFMNPSGQRSNLGDSVLRQGLIGALRPHARLRVLTGPDPAYASGLRVQPGEADARASTWLGSASLHPSAALVLNAGEWVGDDRRAMLWQQQLTRLRRLARRPVLASGIGLRRPADLGAAAPLRALLDRADLLEWRDPVSRDAYGRGDVIPDWAFSLGDARADVATGRPLLAVSMRGDRDGRGEQWYEAVRTLAADLGLEIVVVVQVMADGPQALRDAERLGGRLISWTGQSHAEWEDEMRAVYSRCVAVVSDRIHALIIGMTQGAVPIGLCPASTEKVERTFAAVTAVPVAFDDRTFDGSGARVDAMRAVVESRPALMADLAGARERLARSSVVRAVAEMS